MKGNKGITLTELMVAITILSIVLVPLSLLVGYGYRSFNEGSERASALRYARKAIDIITNDLRTNWDENTGVEADSGTLIVKSIEYPHISYSYSESGGRGRIIRRIVESGGTITSNSIFAGESDEPEINVVSFVPSTNDIGTEKLINVDIEISYGNSKAVSVSQSFRVKLIN